jgi:hypothetical protein
MYHKIVALIFLFCSQMLFSGEFSFQTTRLRGTGGTGVGSILLDEATVLNPAPMAFYNLTAVYVQRTGTDTTTNINDVTGSVKSENYAAIVSDTKSMVKGSVSYVTEKIENNKNTLISGSTAFPIKKKSAIGLTYRNLTTTTTSGGIKKDVKSSQYVIGASHNISPNLSVGAVFIDPLAKNKNDTQAVLGGQMIYGDFIALMLDVGANYNFPLDETLLYRGAVQIMFFTDVYLRAGYFNDKGLEEKGTGVGLGWVQPKLALEAALKNSKGFSAAKTVKETSFSLSYRF